MFGQLVGARVPGLGPSGGEGPVLVNGKPSRTPEGHGVSYIDDTTHVEYIATDPQTLGKVRDALQGRQISGN